MQVFLAVLVAVAAARPDYASSGSSEEATVLRQDLVIEDDGTFVAGHETSNGIYSSVSGSPDGPDGAVVKSGSYS